MDRISAENEMLSSAKMYLKFQAYREKETLEGLEETVFMKKMEC